MMGVAKLIEGGRRFPAKLGDEVTEKLTIGQLFSEFCNLWMARGLTFSSFQV